MIASRPSAWRRVGEVLVLERWPDPVEVLVSMLRDDAEGEVARVESKFGVTTTDVAQLRAIAAREVQP